MTDRRGEASAPRGPTAQARSAELAVARFRELSGEFRGCAILGADGVLAATGAHAEWEGPARRLLEVADDAASGAATHAHVATEEGEAYAVRHGGLAMVAVTERFALASLVLADMRAALREVAHGSAAVLAEVA